MLGPGQKTPRQQLLVQILLIRREPPLVKTSGEPLTLLIIHPEGGGTQADYRGFPGLGLRRPRRCGIQPAQQGGIAFGDCMMAFIKHHHAWPRQPVKGIHADPAVQCLYGGDRHNRLILAGWSRVGVPPPQPYDPQIHSLGAKIDPDLPECLYRLFAELVRLGNPEHTPFRPLWFEDEFHGCLDRHAGLATPGRQTHHGPPASITTADQPRQAVTDPDLIIMQGWQGNRT